MKTKDFGLASLLVCKNCPIQNFNADEFGQTWFEFEDSPTTRELETAFFKNAVSVPVQDFLAAMKMVKSVFYNQRGRQHERCDERFSGRTSTEVRG